MGENSRQELEILEKAQSQPPLSEKYNELQKILRHKETASLTEQDWYLRIPKDQLPIWIASQQKHVLFFDGASQGNRGAVSAGGAIWDPG